jgi:hypothetical protein
MFPRDAIRLTVLSLELDAPASPRIATFELHVESPRPLPTDVYLGSVRIFGTETTPTGVHRCRLLRHFQVDFLNSTKTGARYRVTLDFSDETPKPTDFSQTNVPPRTIAESIDVVSRRVAGLFGRWCEDYRPPFTALIVETPSSEGDLR